MYGYLCCRISWRYFSDAVAIPSQILHFFGVTGFHTTGKMRYFKGKSFSVPLANIVHK